MYNVSNQSFEHRTWILQCENSYITIILHWQIFTVNVTVGENSKGRINESACMGCKVVSCPENIGMMMITTIQIGRSGTRGIVRVQKGR
jgi:hypothetical protein